MVKSKMESNYVLSKDIQRMNLLFTKIKKGEISVEEFAKTMKWDLKTAIKKLEAIFDNPDRYNTHFYILKDSKGNLSLMRV